MPIASLGVYRLVSLEHKAHCTVSETFLLPSAPALLAGLFNVIMFKVTFLYQANLMITLLSNVQVQQGNLNFSL